jgi:hypothetical protein
MTLDPLHSLLMRVFLAIVGSFVVMLGAFCLLFVVGMAAMINPSLPIGAWWTEFFSKLTQGFPEILVGMFFVACGAWMVIYNARKVRKAVRSEPGLSDPDFI